MERLELGFQASDPEKLRQLGIERSCERHMQSFEILLNAIPEEFHDHILSLIEPPSHERERFSCRHPGISALALEVWHGWQPKPIPAAVVQSFLDWPCFEPLLRCNVCQLRLPYTSGIWVRKEPPGGKYQAPFVPFRVCPDCGGQVVDRNGSAPDCKSYLPVLPDPPWQFYLLRYNGQTRRTELLDPKAVGV
jgi:hypothetical protein